MKLTVPGGVGPMPTREPVRYERCEHPLSAVCRRVQANGVVVAVRQCRRCGSNMGNVPKSSVDIDALPVFDGQLQKAWWAAQSRLQSQATAEQNERWNQWYSAYLLSGVWRAKRAAALNRDQHLCQGCRNATATQVHHLTYARVGRELLIDLTSLCDDCHDAAHEKEPT